MAGEGASASRLQNVPVGKSYPSTLPLQFLCNQKTLSNMLHILDLGAFEKRIKQGGRDTGGWGEVSRLSTVTCVTEKGLKNNSFLTPPATRLLLAKHIGLWLIFTTKLPVMISKDYSVMHYHPSVTFKFVFG